MIFLHNVGSQQYKMPKVKNFRKLSRRQKNPRLKQIHISENFVPEIVNLNQKTNDSLKNSNQKASNSLLVQKTSNHVSQFFDNENFCNNFLENMVTNAAIKQSNISHISKYSLSPEKERPLFNNKQILLREKLILWTDKHKVEQKSLTTLLNILRRSR